MHADIKLNSTKIYANLLLASIGLALAFIGGLSVNADTYRSDNFQILDPVIGAGAKYATSTNYILWQSLGESGSGKSTTTNFELNPGFLPWPVSSPATNVSASAGDGQATVSWTAGTGILGWTLSGYTIGQSTASGGPYTYSSKGNVTTATVSSLTNGTAYYFVVVNEDAFGNYIATSTEVSATPSAAAPSCGDGSCNGSETCSTCPADCGACGGGGGGGGGGAAPTTAVVLQGKAYPQADLTILKDGQIATDNISADANGDFKVTLTALSAGTYTFGIWAEDTQGRRSITFSFTITVTSGVTTTIGNIFIPPTIELDQTGVKKGDTLNIMGQSAPQSVITIKINSPQEIIKTATTTNVGGWKYVLDTSLLEDGSHYIKAKAVHIAGLESSYSSVLAFYVGTGVAPGKTKTADLNLDNRVNLIDFSILLYNWGTPRNTKADINGDGWVNLVDFSIMMYQWTA